MHILQRDEISLELMGKLQSEVHFAAALRFALTCSSSPCFVVGVQLLQVGGTAVCVDWLSTFGIQTTQLTLQDENGIYTLINSFYFFVRRKGETGAGGRDKLPAWLYLY